MIYWAQFLHFYQPPTQLPPVLEKICRESYRPLLTVLYDNPHIKVTVNINGCLSETLGDIGHSEILDRMRRLGERGQIEFAGTAKYHPILPLIPEEERRRQIMLNQKANSYFFGDAFKPQGFFPPEMAYSKEIVPAILASGHRWVIASGVACPNEWPVDRVVYTEYRRKKLAVFFRDDILSNKISFGNVRPDEFLGHLHSLKGSRENIYVITAMDAETYGHHIQNWERVFLAEVYGELKVGRATFSDISQRTALGDQQTTLLMDTTASKEVKAVTISELLDLFPSGEIIDPKASSWSTSGEDIQAGNPFPLWADPGNEIHRLLWEHLEIAHELTESAVKYANNDESHRFADIARGLLDRAYHSCQFWWASRRPMWDVNMIHMGIIEQWRVIVNAYRSINMGGADGEEKKNSYYKAVAARDIRNKITDRLFSI